MNVGEMTSEKKFLTSFDILIKVLNENKKNFNIERNTVGSESILKAARSKVLLIYVHFKLGNNMLNK
jgi:hypothetical protein